MLIILICAWLACGLAGWLVELSRWSRPWQRFWRPAAAVLLLWALALGPVALVFAING